MAPVKELGGVGEESFLPSLPPPPTFIFLALVSFLAGPKPRIPFLGLSLLRNQTETLATQARIRAVSNVIAFIPALYVCQIMAIFFRS